MLVSLGSYVNGDKKIIGVSELERDVMATNVVGGTVVLLMSAMLYIHTYRYIHKKKKG